MVVEFDIVAKEAAAAAVVDIAAAVAVLQRDPFAPFAAAEKMLHYWAQHEQLVVEPMAKWHLELQELIVAAVLPLLAVVVAAVLLAAEAEAEADESQIQASEAFDPQTEALPLKQLAVDILEAQHSVAVVAAAVVVVSVVAAH